MKIWMITSEMTPLVKTGGLADVLGALPQALAARGHTVAVALPFYGQVRREGLKLELALAEIFVDLPVGRRALRAWQGTLPGNGEDRGDVTVYLIEDPYLFHRPQLYAEDGREYADNPLRFAYFCMASLWLMKGLDWRPDVIHGHDWQAAIAPLYLHYLPQFRNDPFFARIKTLFSIHNLSYQGIYPAPVARQIGLPPEAFRIEGVEFYGNLNLMKGALLHSDRLTTVSRQYAEEIQTPAYGYGLERLLQGRAAHLTGILNGIDPHDWNPATDALLPATYTGADRTGKTRCKQSLQERFGLPASPKTPLMGIVSRLVDQKGFDLLAASLEEVLLTDVHLVVLGSGQPEYQDFFTRLAAQFPLQVGVKIGFDNALAHQIEAGSDLFLMPSHFEPCGLNQMYSLAYGSVPVVRRTGGLADTIVHLTPETLAAGTANGFVFEAYTAPALLTTLTEALRVYREEPKTWARLIDNGMAEDHSWGRAAAEYERVMEEMLIQP